VGYLIGSKGNRLARKFSSEAEEAKARTFLEKYGSIAIIASRPIPVLAESVSIMSGTLNWSYKKVLLNSFVGLLPVSFVYSLTGAYSTSFNSAAIAFLINIGMAGLIWLITRWKK
jgi:membrane protein DedA with SNARE-associated domain